MKTACGGINHTQTNAPKFNMHLKLMNVVNLSDEGWNCVRG